jgi:hypothetical protein
VFRSLRLGMLPSSVRAGVVQSRLLDLAQAVNPDCSRALTLHLARRTWTGSTATVPTAESKQGNQRRTFGQETGWPAQFASEQEAGCWGQPHPSVAEPMLPEPVKLHLELVQLQPQNLAVEVALQQQLPFALFEGIHQAVG